MKIGLSKSTSLIPFYVSGMSCWRLLPALIFVLAIGVYPCFAQTDSGTITGTVRDASGGLVVGADVAAKNLGTGYERTTQTGDAGQYTLPGLTAGNYELTFTHTGFAPSKQRAEVTVGAHLSVDAQLSVGAQTTTMEVTAGEGGTQVNTETQEVSEVISPREMTQLPSLNRNVYDFVGGVGNVSGGDRMGVASDQNTGTRGVGYVINGQRSTGAEILLDGAENIDLFTAQFGQAVSPDMVQEYRVITNNFEAQYGRASGGVVNVITKGGTNNFHGTAWEYNRLSAYTANTFDNNANKAPKGHYTRNQFGYAVGGPIFKDKLFFFQGTEFTRVRSAASILALVPTPQLLALTAPSVQAYFAKYGGATAPFVSTIKKLRSDQAPNGIDIAAGNGGYKARGTFDNTVGTDVPAFGLVNFLSPQDSGGGSPQNTHNVFGRMDYNLSTATQLYARVNWYDEVDFLGSQFGSPYAQYNVGQEIYDRAFMLNVTHSFGPHLLSSTKLSFNRDDTSNSYNTALQNTPTLYLFSSATINGTAVQLPGFYDNQTGTGGLPYGGPANAIQGNEDLSWIVNRHTLRFGGQVNYQQMNRGYGAYGQANEVLAKNITDGLDNFITGKLITFQVAIDPQGKFPCSRDASGKVIETPACRLTLPVGAPSFTRSYRYRDFALYAQDSWRMTPRLVLNYGLRYEYYGVQHNSRPELDSNLYYGSGATLFDRLRNAQMLLSQNSPIHGLWKPRYGDLGPRIGFAYDVFGDGKTSIRGGYGISYERNFGNVTFNMIQNPPNYASVQLTGDSAGTVTVDNLGPFAGSSGTVPLSPSSPRHVDQNIATAQTQMWSLTVERELAKNTVLSVDYNGAHGIHLYDISNYNMFGSGQAYLGDPLTCGTPPAPPAVCLTRVNQQWSSINTRGSNGFSHYNAMNVRFQSQNFMSTGLLLVANYTYAHALDDLSSTFSESAGASNGVGNLGYLDPRNPRLDYGSSDFDIRHRLVVSAIWDEPFFRSGRGWRRQALGGWSLIPTFTARTGVPFSIVDSANTLSANSGVPSGIPRYTPITPITNFKVNTSKPDGINVFDLLTLPAPDETCNPAWISPAPGTCVETFGPFRPNMTTRNAFVGPGAWNADFAVTKSFQLTERVSLQLRAEMFDIFNHHNMYVNGYVNDANGATGSFTVTGKKGGLGALAGSSIVSGSPADERRFGQFAIRVTF
jgi:outer membrane receptor protein involved in Fe transport